MSKSNLHPKKSPRCGFETQGNSGSPRCTLAKKPVLGAGIPGSGIYGNCLRASQGCWTKASGQMLQIINFQPHTLQQMF